MRIEDYYVKREIDGTRVLIEKANIGELWNSETVAVFAATPGGIETADVMDALLTQFREGDNFAVFWKARQTEHAKQMKQSGFSKDPINFGEAMSLIHSEVSEALEYDRTGNGQSDHIPNFLGVEEELADVVLRIMHLADRKGLRIAEALRAKMIFNATRPVKHGGKEY